jgi:hypothetical protein
MTQPLSAHGTLLQLGDGDGTIGSVTQTGSGLDDMTVSSPESAYTGHLDYTFRVEIDGTGTPDTFKWSVDGGVTWEEELVEIPGAATPYLLQDGVYIEFAATTGHTSTDYWEFDVSVDLTSIAEVVDISGPSFSQSTFDAPSQDTTWMKRVAGIVTAGEISFEINMIPKNATHDDATGLLSLLGALDDHAFALVFNDAGTGTKSQWRFSGYMVGFEHEEPVDGILKASCTIQINGEPTFIKGSS